MTSRIRNSNGAQIFGGWFWLDINNKSVSYKTLPAVGEQLWLLKDLSSPKAEAAAVAKCLPLPKSLHMMKLPPNIIWNTLCPYNTNYDITVLLSTQFYFMSTLETRSVATLPWTSTSPPWNLLRDVSEICLEYHREPDILESHSGFLSDPCGIL